MAAWDGAGSEERLGHNVHEATPPVRREQRVPSERGLQRPMRVSEGETRPVVERGLRRPMRVPVGEEMAETMNYALWDDTDVADTVSVAQTGATARINQITVPMAISKDLLKAQSVPKFSGKPEDWDDFERAWNIFFQTLSAVNGGRPMGDGIALLTLKDRLDGASREMLHRRLAENPGLKYYSFFGELKGRFVRGGQALHRQNWKDTHVTKAGVKPTMLEWVEFCERYKSRRARVQGWTMMEDRELVLRDLPSHVFQKVMDEERDRKRNTFWVRVMHDEALDGRRIFDELQEEFGGTLRLVQLSISDMLISCPSRGVSNELQGYDGGSFFGGTLRVQADPYRMSGDDIMAFVEEFLEGDEDNRKMGNALGIYARDPAYRGPGGQPKDQQSNQRTGAPTGGWKGGGKGASAQAHAVGAAQVPGGNPQATNQGGWQTVGPKGKGKGKGKGGKGGYNNNWTPPAQAAQPMGGQGFQRDPCFTCRNAGRDANHNYWACQHAIEARGARAAGLIGPGGAQGQGAPKPQAKPAAPVQTQQQRPPSPKQGGAPQ